MSIKPDKEVLEAMKKEGTLGKQGRSVLNKYFKRYWKIIDNALTLGYAQDKQSFDQGKLSGKIALKDILTIADDDKPKKFQLICEGRVYKLEADSPQTKKEWIHALNKCMAYASKFAKEEKKDLLAIDDDIIFEESEDLDEKRTQRFNLLFLGVIADTVKDVAVDGVVGTTVGLVKTGVRAVGDVIVQKDRMASNETFLVAKKLNQTLDFIDPKILKSRIIMGYLYKETKETFGFSHLDNLVNDVGFKDTLNRQWFLMVSSKPIKFDEVDRDDEEILDAGKLPTDMDPEVLYAYNETCDGSAPVQVIPMKDVIDVTIKKKANREQFYRFVLNLGKKKIYLITHNVMEMTTWVKAIQASRAVIKEQAKSKLPVVKNLYWHRRILDEQGEEDLMEKIEMDYELIVSKIEANKVGGVEGLISTQKAVADELISVINACLVQKDQRLDIVRFYIGCFHENIIKSFRNYYQKNDKNLDNKDCFEMINFLIWYRDLIGVFGSAFSDKRINDGIGDLCNLVARRILRSNLESIQNIIKQEIKTEPRVDGKGRLVTNGPQDIFRIVDESFQVISYCNCKEFAFALLEIEKSTLINYQESLGETIENTKLNVKQLVAFCNNTVVYLSSVKQFIQNAETVDSIDSRKIPEYFDEGRVNRGFANVSKKAYERIAEDQFESLNDQWKNAFFLDVDLRLATIPGLKNVQSVMDKIHTNYITKVDIACLEKIVTCYIQSFLRTAENKKFRRGDCAKISSKLHEDEIFLRELFSKNLKPNAIEEITVPLTNFHDFLNTNYAFLSLLVKTMKETYGNSMKWHTLDALIRVREDDLEPEENDELFKVCEETFKTTVKNREKANVFNVFRRVTADYDDTNDDGNNDSALSSDKKENSNAGKSFTDQYLEGYLDAEKDEVLSDIGGLILSNLKFERRYFTIRRDILYFYKAKNSERAMGSYNLKDVIECAISKEDTVTFYIELQGKNRNAKKFFKADSPEKRDQWVLAINDVRSLGSANALLEVHGDINLFKDTKPLFHELEKISSVKVAAPKKVVKKEAPSSFQPPPEKESTGCCAAFCRIFGFGDEKPKNNTDYMPIKDVL